MNFSEEETMFGMEFGMQELLVTAGIAAVGELFTAISKATKGRKGSGWQFCHGISSGLARLIPTFSDRGK